MSMLFIDLMRRHLAQSATAIAIVALVAFACVQHARLKHDATKLEATTALHLQDEQRIANLAKDLTDQNAAIGALQAAQTQKEQVVEKALVIAKVQKQKADTLLAPTENKKPASCAQAMPDVRNILKGLAE